MRVFKYQASGIFDTFLRRLWMETFRELSIQENFALFFENWKVNNLSVSHFVFYLDSFWQDKEFWLFTLKKKTNLSLHIDC